jgi:hypothetical protein
VKLRGGDYIQSHLNLYQTLHEAMDPGAIPLRHFVLLGAFYHPLYELNEHPLFLAVYIAY